MEAATDLIAKRGYHGTTIELIIRRAKLGYATFYKNFAGKEESLIAIFDAAEEKHRADGFGTRTIRMTAPGPTGSLRPCRPSSRRSPPTRPPPASASWRRSRPARSRSPATCRCCNVRAALAAGEGAQPARRGAARDARADPLRRRLLDRLSAPHRRRGGQAAGLLPETIELVLSPYVGEDEAVGVAAELGEDRPSLSEPNAVP